MAVSVVTSLQQISDSNGDPVSGATVTVYDAGTTTPKALFSNAGLSVVAANPIVCDAFGRHDMMYFAAGTYKIVVKTSGGSTLYTRDNIDPSVPLGSGALAIINGGTGATTAGGARTNLGVPSQTEMDDATSDIAALQSAINAITGVPQGRLTLSTATPVMTGDVSAATNVYYTPYFGAQIPIYNGTAFVTTTFAELTLALVSNHVASTIYDLFVISDGGTVRLVSGPAWNVSTAGSGSRGSGAGTTGLTRLSGILVNANAITGRYGATTVSVAANQGTYVGSMFMDGTNGQLTCHFSFGQSRKFGLWNAYNRTEILLKAGDSTASWTYATNTWRAANGSSSNSLSIFTGLSEHRFDLEFYQQNTGNTTTSAAGIGFNSTSAPSGTISYSPPGIAQTYSGSSAPAKYIVSPALGVQTVTALEKALNGTVTLVGAELNMALIARYIG